MLSSDVIGCLGVDDFGGTATVYINTETGKGARQGEDFGLAVARPGPIPPQTVSLAIPAMCVCAILMGPG